MNIVHIPLGVDNMEVCTTITGDLTLCLWW
jgi:hypothetical protein